MVRLSAPLAEKFWFHCTNAANSDGRWPPPPAKPCEFNRQWVKNEIDATRTALATLAKATKKIASIPADEEEPLADSPEYGLHFTDKDTSILPGLSFYKLQHALYAAWRASDHTTGPQKQANLGRVRAIYDEYRRRGIHDFIDPTH